MTPSKIVICRNCPGFLEGTVIPAKAGIQSLNLFLEIMFKTWIPAFAGMTTWVVTICLCLFTTGLSAAQNAKEIKFKSRDLEKVKAELDQKRQEKERLQKEAEDLSKAVKQSEEKINDIQTSLLYTKQKSFEIERQLAGTKNRHDQLWNVFSNRKEAFHDSVRTYCVASVLTSPHAPMTVYSRQMIRAQAKGLKKSASQTDEERRNFETLVETQQAIRGEVEKQEEKLSTIRSGRKDKERLLDKKKTRQEILETELKDLHRTAQELASLIDILRSKAKEEAVAEKETRRQKQLSGAAPIPLHSLPWPVRGKVVTRFGRQQHPALGTTFISNGVVLSTDGQQSVQVVADGKVLYAGEFMSYGSMAVIEHAGDWYTVYGHLSRWTVEKGQEMKKGDTVGLSRPSQGGGEEAYFELRFYGKPTDPLPWLESQTR